MREQLDNPSRARRGLSRLATTLAAWLVAFLIVLGLLTLFGDELESLPLALDALVFTGVLVPVMGNLVMPVLSVAVAGWVAGGPRPGAASPYMNDNSRAARQHPQLEALPDWPTQTIAVLATVDHRPHAIPVSAPLRAGDRRILLSLHRDRGSLARLRERPQVALTILADDDTAITARGRARIVEEPMARAPDYAAVAIDVDHIDDQRQAAFHLESGIDRRWVDEDERHALRQRVEALTELAASAA
ncbi:MAG: pyridoxamine 5'-phosphate oxidase family protein [Solirubrobacteraceae bacterium]